MFSESALYRRFWLPSALIFCVGLLSYAFCLGADARGAGGFAGFPHANLGAHLLCGLLVFLVAETYFESAGWLSDGRSRRAGALVAALIFSAHPLASATVNDPPGFGLQILTMTSLVAVGSGLRYCRTLRWPWAVVAALALVACAFAAVPGGLYAAVAAAAILAAFFPFAAFFARFAPTRRDKVIAAAIPTMLIAAAWKPLASVFQWVGATVADTPYLGHVLTQGRVFWHYLLRVAYPADLSTDHMIPETVSLADGTAVALTVGVGILVVALVAAHSSRRFRPAAALATLFCGAFLIWMLIPTRGTIIEMRAYPALPWFAVGAGLALALVSERNGSVGRSATIILVFGLSMLSARRSAEWQSSSTLASAAVQSYPLNLRARNTLMRNALSEGNFHRVPLLHAESLEAWLMIKDFNAAAGQTGRSYPEAVLLSEMALSERYHTLALAELKGHGFAMSYADGVIPGLRAAGQRIPGDDGKEALPYESHVQAARNEIANRKAATDLSRSGASDAAPRGPERP